MYLLLLGLALLLLKYLQVEPVAAWDWWWVLSPLGAAVLWWWWADHFGYTKRQTMAKMDERKRRRLDASRRRLGLPPLDRR
ncbi:TIGR04438 family Trp-rich protein [Malikia granosa]|uniref:TIGR04438 family Trp-rich protein n=1 Tax=Malikia granosa TaxID=263067 RepID=A0A2S9K7R9_9BURK|nr:TIGR04438 family Trp-rich protein [Malikia granosa]PRD66500.1 TIGR04438 family Trp-rich protein [Malikia granosa]